MQEFCSIFFTEVKTRAYTFQEGTLLVQISMPPEYFDKSKV